MKRIFVVLTVLLAVMAFFVINSKTVEQSKPSSRSVKIEAKTATKAKTIAPTENQLIAKVEPTPNSEMAQPPALNQQLINQKQADNNPQEINYLLVEEAFKVTEEQALALLEEYKLHQSKDSAESHYATFVIKQKCTGLKFETQQELDNWIADDKWSVGRDEINLEAMEVMRSYAHCRKVIDYVGDETFENIELRFSSLIEAEKRGHPIAKLILHKSKLKSLDSAEFTKLFSEAYEYSKKYPKYMVEVHSVALGFLSRVGITEDNSSYQALWFMAFRDGIAFNENINLELVSEGLKGELDNNFLPLEVEEIKARIEEIAMAMENGDWSWLQYIDSET